VSFTPTNVNQEVYGAADVRHNCVSLSSRDRRRLQAWSRGSRAAESSRPPVARNPINPLPDPGVAAFFWQPMSSYSFPFFSQLRADDLRDKIAHRRNGWNQEAIASPGAAFGRASQGRSLNQSIAVDGGLLVQSGRTAGRLWRTAEMVSTSVTRPIVVVHQPNPKFYRGAMSTRPGEEEARRAARRRPSMEPL
jgi:hypothetical protein